MAVTVGDAQKQFTEEIAKFAGSLRVGNGLDKDVRMGPVITPESKTRIEGLIAKGADEGAKVLLDGRTGSSQSGNFLQPTILDGVPSSARSPIPKFSARF